jgi:hypothetical protein
MRSTIMFESFLPRSADNSYRGRQPALWIFGLLTLMKLVIGINSIVNGWAVLTTADGIPLASYPAGAAQTIVSLWALLGLARVVLCVIYLLVLVRYRGLIPFFYILFLLQSFAGDVILHFLPLARVGAPPASLINNIFLALTLLGLVLSLWRGRSRG